MRYITKPISQNELFFDLEIVLKKIIQKNLFVYDEKIPSLKLYHKDIFYIEVIGRYTYVHNKKDIRKFNKPLKIWSTILENNYFCKCHNSFLVNLSYVYQINAKTVILVNQTILPLSRTHKKRFNQAFLLYIEETHNKCK